VLIRPYIYCCGYIAITINNPWLTFKASDIDTCRIVISPVYARRCLLKIEVIIFCVDEKLVAVDIALPFITSLNSRAGGCWVRSIIIMYLAALRCYLCPEDSVVDGGGAFMVMSQS
jgi:hypothetical protein